MSADEGPSPNLSPTEEEQVRDVVDGFLDQLQAGARPDLARFVAARLPVAREAVARIEALKRLHDLMEASCGSTTLPVHSCDTEGERSEGPAQPFPPRLGRYEVHGQLGAGAFSVVLWAYDPKFEREVALKVMKGSVGEGFLSLFERDARITARLRHPHIVPLHEAGEHEGRPFLDMELVCGESLEQRLRRAPALTPRQSAELIHKLALALDHAHKADVVHRDVKPSNVLLDEEGEPQLTDFGLARCTALDVSISRPGDVVGTLPYASPEQLAGRAGEVDGRSDVYSLGVVFYRLLAGRLPFQGATAPELLGHAMRGDPPAPRRLAPAIPAGLETVCLKAMAREPGDRFGTASAFADELWRWLHDEPLTVRPPTLGERARRWARRHRPVALVLTAAAVALALVSALLGRAAYEARLSSVAARAGEAREARTRAELAVRARLDRARVRLQMPTAGRRLEAQALLRETAKDRADVVPGERADALDHELRSLFVASLGVPDVAPVAEQDATALPRLRQAAWPLALRPDGKGMAVGAPGGPVYWERGGKFTAPHGVGSKAPPPHLTYSPDGAHLVFWPAKGGLEVWDREATRSRVLERRGKGPVLAVGFGAEGKSLWALRADGALRSWSLPGLEEGAARRVGAGATAAAFSADAVVLAVGHADGRVVLEKLAGGPSQALPAARTAVQALAWSPDAQHLAVGTRDGNVSLWQTAGTPTPSHQFAPFGGGIGDVQFTPDGRWLLAGATNWPTRVWDVHSGERLLTIPYRVGGMADTRAGSLLFAGSFHDRAVFGEVSIPRALARFTGHRAQVARLAWSRDRRYLATLDHRYVLRVLDARAHRAVAAIEAPPGEFFGNNGALALSGDGGLLAYASGGRTRSEVRIYETATGRERAKWALGGGFEYLAWVEGGTFRLVREELEPGKPLRTVVRELTAGKAPHVVRALRGGEPGDRALYLEAGLSPDGKHYWWSGPREPADRRRVEVWDVETGKQVVRVPHRHPPEEGEVVAVLGAGAKKLWVVWRGRADLHDLTGAEPPRHVKMCPLAVAPVGERVAYATSEGWLRLPALTVWRKGKPLFDLPTGGAPAAVGGSEAFSSDGRSLAWADATGAVWLADLEALEKAVDAFVRSLRAD